MKNTAVNKQELQYQKSFDKCENVLSCLNTRGSEQQNSKKREINNELNSIKKKVEQSIMASKESLRTNKYNDYKFSELLSTCMKHTEEWLKIMNKIKNDLDTNNPKIYSSNSSIQSESDFKQPVNMVKGIKNKLNELTEYMININDKIKSHKIKRSQQILILKKTNCVLSELCDTIIKKINDEI